MRHLGLIFLAVSTSGVAAAGNKCFPERWAQSEVTRATANERTSKMGYEGPAGAQRRTVDEVRRMSNPRTSGRRGITLNGVEFSVFDRVGKGLALAKDARLGPARARSAAARPMGDNEPNRQALRLLISKRAFASPPRNSSRAPWHMAHR
jgi:hypothetical protein